MAHLLLLIILLNKEATYVWYVIQQAYPNR